MLRFLRSRTPADEDRYRPIARLGEGGAAIVTRAFDTVLHRIVALKTLKTQEGGDATARRTFEREARLVAFLDHPGVVPLYDRTQGEDHQPAYVMKAVEGRTLSALLDYTPRKGGQALGASEAVGLFARVGETLAYAHDRGVAHLDLKPDNVMIGRYGEVLLMDWGNARLFDAAPYRAWLGTHADPDAIDLLAVEPPDLLSGTPRFMSPEQTSRPRDTLGAASDVFSAGTLLYLMLTGAHPFAGKDAHALFAAIRDEEPVPVRQRNPEVPQRLGAIVMHMLAKREADRPSGMHAVLEALRRYQAAGDRFPVRHLEPGDLAFEEGAEGDAAYVIVSGRVAIEKGGQELATLGPGEVFGEIAILTRERRSASVRAVEPTTVRVMAQADVERELEKIPPWVGAMVTTLGTRFLALNEELASRRARDPASTDADAPQAG